MPKEIAKKTFQNADRGRIQNSPVTPIKAGYKRASPRREDQ